MEQSLGSKLHAAPGGACSEYRTQRVHRCSAERRGAAAPAARSCQHQIPTHPLHLCLLLVL